MSELAMVATAPNAIEVSRQVHDDEVREAAFEVWWLYAGRNASQTQRLLKLEEYGGYEIPLRTVCDWVNRFDWAGELERRIRHVAPKFRNRVDDKAMFASDSAMDYLTGVIAGGLPADRDRIAACRLAFEVAGIVGKSAASVQQIIVPGTSTAPAPRITGLPSDDRGQLAESLASIAS